MPETRKRDPGTGSVYLRGETWWIAYRHRGKQQFESSKISKKMVAVELLKKRLGEVSRGKPPEIHFEIVTFKELAEDFVRDREVNDGDRKDAEKRLSYLNPFFEEVWWAVSITTPKVNEYITVRMAEGAANATITESWQP